MSKGQIWTKTNNIWLPTISREGSDSSYRWESSEWSECTKECGSGIQERNVWCVDINTNQQVADSVCELAWGEKPEEIRDCNTESCTQCFYSTKRDIPTLTNEFNSAWIEIIYNSGQAFGVHIVFENTWVTGESYDLINYFDYNGYRYTRGTFKYIFDYAGAIIKFKAYEVCRTKITE